MTYAVPVLVLVGCIYFFTGKSGHPSVYPVEGQVFFENQPAAGALVFLHPIDSTDPKARKPTGVVGEDGTFHLTTYSKGDGAAPGKYRIYLVWTKATKGGDELGENLLPDHYHDPQKSGLPIVEIKEEPNQLPPIQLTRQPPDAP